MHARPLAQRHLSPEILSAYQRGVLSPGAVGDVEAHLEGCEPCCLLLDGQADPAFQAKVRQAGGKGTPNWTPRPSESLPSGTMQPGARGEPSAKAAIPPVPPTAPPLPEWSQVQQALANHPRYRIKRKLGEGGMGVVFLAEDLRLERQVALKAVKLAPELESQVMARFEREVKVCAKLSHPNIATVYDAEQAVGVCFFVMEYLEGEDLRKYVGRKGPLAVHKACAVAYLAANALQHAHERGLVHRDVKPDNLLLTKSSVLKLLDFGLARILCEVRQGTALTQVQEFMGTPDYVAPEQASDAATADGRADVYSLGCTLYFLLTGRPPFPGGSLAEKFAAHLMKTPKSLRAQRPEVPAAVEAVVMKMMAKDVTGRYQTPKEVAEALRPYCEKAKKAVEKPRGRRPGWWKAVAAGVMGLALVAAGAVYTIQTDKGVVKVETLDDAIEVVIRQNGKEVTILDTKTKQKATLWSGKLKAEVKNAPEWEVETSEFELKRGGVVTVRVTRKPVVPPPVPPGPGGAEEKEKPKVVPESPLKEWVAEAAVSGETAAHEGLAAVAMDNKGRSVVVWQRYDGKTRDIYGRMFDETGKATRPAFEISKGEHQGNPQVAMSPKGGFIVAWVGTGAKGKGIYARRFDADGKPVGDEFKVNTAPAAETGVEPTGLACNVNGEFTILYTLGINGGAFHAYIQRFDGDGKAVGSEERVNRRWSLADGISRLAIAKDRRIAVAYGTGREIILQVFKADGARDGSEFMAHTSASTGKMALGNVQFDDHGKLSVVWEATSKADGTQTLFLRRFVDRELKPVDVQEVSITESGPNSSGFVLGQRGSGEGVVLFTSGFWPKRTARLRCIADGKPVGPAILATDTFDGDQQNPKVCVNDAGKVLLVWLASPPSRDKQHVFMRGVQIAKQPR